MFGPVPRDLSLTVEDCILHVLVDIDIAMFSTFALSAYSNTILSTLLPVATHFNL